MKDGRGGPGRGTTAGEHTCVFWLGEHRYALDAVLVREVVSVPSIVPVPATAAWLVGLANLRGVAMAVLDLVEVLEVPRDGGPPAARENTNVLVLHTGRTLAGVRIDRIEAVYPFDTARLETSAAVGEHPAVKGILTFTLHGGFSATLLDERRLAERIESLRFRKAEGEAVLPAV